MYPQSFSSLLNVALDQPAVEFGEHELCPRTRTLLRNGHPVNLEPKVFILLVYLVSQRQRVVPHQELHALLWPDTQVTSNALSRLVKELRKALGDNGGRQTTVRTAFKFGYRFVADLKGEDIPALRAS